MSRVTPGTSGRPPGSSNPTDADGFSIPIGRKRGRPRKKDLINMDEDAMSGYSVSTNNSYGSLDDNDPGESAGQRKRQRTVKTKRPPPIIIPNLNFQQVNEQLKGVKEINPSNINRRITKEGVKLFLTSSEEHKLMRGHLDQVKTKYTTFTRDEDRMTRFVMYGLPITDPVEVQAAIIAVSQLKPVAVKHMKITKKLYPEQCNYLIYFNKTSNVSIEDIWRITGILGYHVFFDYYQKSGEPTQCFNCQGFTHASANCTLDPRCVRCAGPHKSKDCTLVNATTKKIPEDQVKCINCGGKHTASSRECPLRIRLTKERQEMAVRRSQTDKRNRYVANFNDYKHTFPSMPQQQNVNNGPPKNSMRMPHSQAWTRTSPSGGEHANQDSSGKFTPRQLMEIFREMNRICAECTNKQQQLDCLMDIFEKYVVYD